MKKVTVDFSFGTATISREVHLASGTIFSIKLNNGKDIPIANPTFTVQRLILRSFIKNAGMESAVDCMFKDFLNYIKTYSIIHMALTIAQKKEVMDTAEDLLLEENNIGLISEWFEEIVRD